MRKPAHRGLSGLRSVRSGGGFGFVAISCRLAMGATGSSSPSTTSIWQGSRLSRSSRTSSQSSQASS